MFIGGADEFGESEFKYEKNSFSPDFSYFLFSVS